MIRFRPLFHVDVLHDYFLNRGSVVFEAQADTDRAALTSSYSPRQFLRVAPDAQTRATLAGHRMIFRENDTGFLVAVQLDSAAPDIRPAVPPGAAFQLTFALQLTDARFTNYTELGPDIAGFRRFGNDSANRVASTNYLTRPAGGFDAARRYVAGSTRTVPAAPTFDLFVALRDTGPSAAPIAADWRRIPADTYDPAESYQAGSIVLSANRVFRAVIDDPGTDLTQPADWQPLGLLGNQYAGASDAARPVAPLFELDIAAAALSQATVRVFRGGSPNIAAEQGFSAAPGVLEAVQVDLRGFASGRYRVQVLDAALVPVPGLDGDVYLAPDALREGWFGAIDIVSGAGDFALLNPDGTLRTPRFALRFLNRATRWRYIFPAAQTVGAGADVAVESGSDRQLVTAAPQPLTRFGSGARLQADAAATPAVSEEILLPAPETKLIRRQNAEWFSEIHLPNLTVGP